MTSALVGTNSFGSVQGCGWACNKAVRRHSHEHPFPCGSTMKTGGLVAFARLAPSSIRELRMGWLRHEAALHQSSKTTQARA